MEPSARLNHTATPRRKNISDERIPPKGRIEAFDALRSGAIFGVIVAHVSMTYMSFAPDWWYIISEKRDLVCWTLVNILDIVLMPVLFFAAGYFTPQSYLKKGFLGFLVDKAKHIFLPWIVGIAVIVPLILLVVGSSPAQIAASLRENPFHLFVHQGHLWFLAILFLFFVAYALWSRLTPPTGERRAGSRAEATRLLWLGFAVSSVFACLSVIYVREYNGWLALARSIILLSPGKIAMYICIFALGIHAWRAKWFTAEGWMPRLSVWRCLCFASGAIYFLLRGAVVPNCGAPIWGKVLLPTLDMAFSFSSMIYLLLVAIRHQQSRTVRRLADLSTYSYGIYWIHSVPMFFYLRAVNELNVPVLFKWTVGIALTCTVSWLACKYILKKTPGLKRMF